MESGSFRGFFPVAKQHFLEAHPQLSDLNIYPWQVYTDPDFVSATPLKEPGDFMTKICFEEYSTMSDLFNNFSSTCMFWHYFSSGSTALSRDYARKLGTISTCFQGSIINQLNCMKQELDKHKCIFYVLKKKANPQKANDR